MNISELGFVVLLVIVSFIVGYLVAWSFVNLRWRARLPQERKDAVQRSRSVVRGQLTEQFAPYLPDFPFKPSEVKFLGKPIDFVAFPGLDDHEPEEVVFIEVKSGKAQLSTRERRLRDVIKKQKVRWEEYRL